MVLGSVHQRFVERLKHLVAHAWPEVDRALADQPRFEGALLVNTLGVDDIVSELAVPSIFIKHPVFGDSEGGWLLDVGLRDASLNLSILELVAEVCLAGVFEVRVLVG